MRPKREISTQLVIIWRQSVLSMYIVFHVLVDAHMWRQSAIIITECNLEIIIACAMVIIMYFSDYLRNCEGAHNEEVSYKEK